MEVPAIQQYLDCCSIAASAFGSPLLAPDPALALPEGVFDKSLRPLVPASW